MCEMLAMNCNSSASIQFSFTGFARRGGCTGDHIDGWGVAFHGEGGSRVFIDTHQASESPLASFVREQSIRAQIVLAHIRKATQGPVSLANCHPFQRQWAGRQWSFCHNGDLKRFDPKLRGAYRTVGDTDSERAYCWLLQELQRSIRPRGTRPTWQRIAPVLHRLALEVSSHGNFNFLLTDGDALYAHCSSRLHHVARSHPFPQASLTDCDLSVDLSALNGPDDRMVVIATAPLTGEAWTPFEAGQTLVFAKGETVWNSREDAPHTALAAGPNAASTSSSGAPPNLPAAALVNAPRGEAQASAC